MNTHLNTPHTNPSNRTQAVLFVLVVALLLLAAYPFTGTADRISAGQPSRIAQESSRAPARLPEVAMLAAEGQSSGTVLTVTKVYSQPDAGARVVDVLTPSQSVHIFGRSADGTYLAAGRLQGATSESPTFAGWISAADVQVQTAFAQARTLARVYQAPDDTSAVINLLAPAQSARILGRSLDRRYYAVANAGSQDRPFGWVQAAEVQSESPVVAHTITLTFLYRQPGSESVTGMINPAQTMTIFGRSPDGKYLAVAGQDGQSFRGWALASEVQVGNRDSLPVITTP